MSSLFQISVSVRRMTLSEWSTRELTLSGWKSARIGTRTASYVFAAKKVIPQRAEFFAQSATLSPFFKPIASKNVWNLAIWVATSPNVKPSPL